MAKKKNFWDSTIKSRSKTNIALSELSDAIDELLEDITEDMYAAVDRGLDNAANHMAQALKNATPVETGKARDSWVVNFKYKNVRYINNTATREKLPGDSKTGGIGELPIVNMLEYSKKGNPFVRKTVVAEQQKVLEIIKGEIENGKT